MLSHPIYKSSDCYSLECCVVRGGLKEDEDGATFFNGCYTKGTIGKREKIPYLHFQPFCLHMLMASVGTTLEIVKR